MLFKDEAPLTAPIAGSADFQKAFRQNRHEINGISLKDFDLNTRLFKHRLSYTIHGQAFKQMHDTLKQAVVLNLEQQLSDEAESSFTSTERLILRKLLKDAVSKPLY